MDDVEDLPSRDVPYDPDMTVTEALEAGLIAVIDGGGAIGRMYQGLCGAKKTEGPSIIGRCTRSKGHKGVHAYIVRWNDEGLVEDWPQSGARPFDDMRRALLDASGPMRAMEKQMQQQLQDLTSKIVKAEREQEEQFLRKAIDRVKPKDMSIEEYAKGMTAAQQGAVRQIADQMKSEIGKAQDHHLHKIDSMVYGGLEAGKKQRFRDQNAGKIRGR